MTKNELKVLKKKCGELYTINENGLIEMWSRNDHPIGDIEIFKYEGITYEYVSCYSPTELKDLYQDL